MRIRPAVPPQLLLSFYDSLLSDVASRRLCLALLQRVAEHEEAAAKMLVQLGVPTWQCGHARREVANAFPN